MKRFLITTADERTWVTDRPVLFLGGWCCVHGRRAAWKELDSEVVPYHWDDRKKYFDDYSYLQRTYEAILGKVAQELNAFHHTGHSLRYWRILLGPWLYNFTHTLFDRWTMTQRAAETYDVEGTIILDFALTDMIAPDFLSVRFDNVPWNHYLFGRAIRYQNAIPWKASPALIESAGESQKTTEKPPGGILRRTVEGLCSAYTGLTTRSDEPMIISSYLPRLEEIKLQMALGQMPKLWAIPSMKNAAQPDLAIRSGLKIQAEGVDVFQRFLSIMIPEQIPTVYLEGYRDLLKAVGDLSWPSRPRVIFTSNLFQFCEVFQAWAAEKTEAGAPLVIGQHGGQIGVGRWVPGEEHQVGISDRYLTWGWQDERAATYPACALTIVNKKPNPCRKDGDLLLVTVPVRLYGFRNNSWPVGPTQSERYLSEQLSFARALPGQVRASLVVRLNLSVDRKMMTFYADRWKEMFPETSIDDSTSSIEGCLRRSRLVVFTYNATGFVEMLARNIPTIFFWNPNFFELRAAAESYFKALKDTDVFHETPEAASVHVAKIWDDVGAWWNDPAVQQARANFCDHYARVANKPIRLLKESLTTVKPMGSV